MCHDRPRDRYCNRPLGANLEDESIEFGCRVFRGLTPRWLRAENVDGGLHLSRMSAPEVGMSPLKCRHLGTHLDAFARQRRAASDAAKPRDESNLGRKGRRISAPPRSRAGRNVLC